MNSKYGGALYNEPLVGIVDYGAGNNFSVSQALRKVGVSPFFVKNAQDFKLADGLVIPGVGAFPEAIKCLNSADMISPLKDYLTSGKPVLAVCLGFQLLMAESYENVRSKGLGFFDASVEPFSSNFYPQVRKVPHIGWSPIYSPSSYNILKSERGNFDRKILPGEIFNGIEQGEFFYFVHSFRVSANSDQKIGSTISAYGPDIFVSSATKGSVSAFQFHPEKSGHAGVKIYRNFARQVISSL